MAKPDSRKRDRAEYMRGYRARRAAVNPSLSAQILALQDRIVELEAGVEHLTKYHDARCLPGIHESAAVYSDAHDRGEHIPTIRPFGRSRPAPKQKAAHAPATRR